MTKKILLIHKCIIVAAILILSTSCSNTGNDIEPEKLGKVNLIANKQAYENAESNRENGTGNELSDPFSIESVERIGNILKVKVTYTGGCEKHTFDLLWNEVVILTYPCQINLILTHNANGDKCEAQITEIIEIDLDEFISGGEYTTTCNLNVFSVLNGSDNPDGIVTSTGD
ncbi:MAG: hypothetical protein COC16_04035 [Lutibacter sp.]|nr:MAG: hypothetical protein COC16_04035 [Lutibacter sp.]